MAAPKKDTVSASEKKPSKKEQLPPEGSAAYKALVLVGKVKAGSK
jgi:LAS superfamily LD-carboxypeptidase LdcB